MAGSAEDYWRRLYEEADTETASDQVDADGEAA